MNYYDLLAARIEEMDNRIRKYEIQCQLNRYAMKDIPALNYTGVPSRMNPYNAKYATIKTNEAR